MKMNCHVLDLLLLNRCLETTAYKLRKFFFKEQDFQRLKLQHTQLRKIILCPD
ncbi:hypothetical protein NSTC731_02791 [Nostoc sp. DSM 114167]|jgi:hypothetical protein